MTLLFRTACWRSLSQTQYRGSGIKKGLFQEKEALGGMYNQALGTVSQEEGVLVPPTMCSQYQSLSGRGPAHLYHPEPPFSLLAPGHASYLPQRA